MHETVEFFQRTLHGSPAVALMLLRRWTLTLCLLSVMQSALAEAPDIVGMLPLGGQRGKTVVLQIEGHRFQKPAALLSGSGIALRAVTANPEGTVASLTIDIASDAPPGPRELRLTTADGVTNPFTIWIDSFPEMLEVEPNDDIAHAQPLPREGVVVNGRIQAANDVDTFSVEAQAGETWTFDCNAAGLASGLDPVLELKEASGRFVTSAQSVWLHDPRLIYRFAKSGRSFLPHDSQFKGGADFVYRLTVGRFPVVTAVLPLGGLPGVPFPLQVEGVNLGALTTAVVTLPPDNSPFPAWISLPVAGALSLPFSLLKSEVPISRGMESGLPIRLAPVPCAVDGILRTKPEQRLTLNAKQGGEIFVLDLLGRRIGSRIDGMVRVLDAAGKELVANDDAIGKDARLNFTAPKPGDYTIVIANVEGKTGPDCAYRLLVHHPSPDFKAYLNVDHLQVGSGGTAAATMVIEREEGFDGPIHLITEDLSDTTHLSGGHIRQGKTEGEFTLTVPAGTGNAAHPIHLYAEATIAGKPIRHELTARHPFVSRTIDLSLLDGPLTYLYRPCALLPLGITPRLEPFALETNIRSLVLAPGQKAEILVRAIRNAGANGEIKLEVRNAPEKVQVLAPSIPAGQTEAHLVLTAPADILLLSDLIIVGKLGTAAQTAPAVTVTIQK